MLKNCTDYCKFAPIQFSEAIKKIQENNNNSAPILKIRTEKTPSNPPDNYKPLLSLYNKTLDLEENIAVTIECAFATFRIIVSEWSDTLNPQLEPFRERLTNLIQVPPENSLPQKNNFDSYPGHEEKKIADLATKIVKQLDEIFFMLKTLPTKSKKTKQKAM